MRPKALLSCLAILAIPRVVEAQTVRLDSAQVESLHQFRDTEINKISQLAHAILHVSPMDPERANSLAHWFVRYGEETETDPRLLAAIAYHESGFKESAYNPAGGGSLSVMQVLPQKWLGKYAKVCEATPTRTNLRKSRVSICYGAHIYAYFRSVSQGSLKKSLRGYNSGFRFLANGYDRRVLNAYAQLGG